MSLVILTGATGFVGTEILNQLIDKDFDVLALVRPGKGALLDQLAEKQNVRVAEVDLSNVASLKEKLAQETKSKKVAALIYASGAMTGNDSEHLKQSIAPLKTIIDFMDAHSCKRIIHLSSLSVYGYSALPNGAMLDETTPLESELAFRDAYCRAKCKQEEILIQATQSRGFSVTSLRLGMVYSKQRFWSARLGFTFKNSLLIPNKDARLPLSNVFNCATATVMSVKRNVIPNEVYIPPSSPEQGAFEAINVIDDYQPTVLNYLSTLEEYGASTSLSKFAIPAKLLNRLLKIISLLQIALPSIYTQLPNVCKIQTYDSRFKTLTFNNARLKDRINASFLTLQQELGVPSNDD
jgi:nucleoside-diphosphate-sugar epimerase